MTGFEAPDFLTIEEAAAVLRISRTAALMPGYGHGVEFVETVAGRRGAAP